MSKKDKTSIADCRKEIDEIDSQILDLINKRLLFVQKIGHIKNEKKTSFYVPSREDSVFRNLLEKNAKTKGVLSEKSLKAIYKEIMSCSLALEHKMKIAYFGQEGSNTHNASLTRFGSSVEHYPVLQIKDIFERVFSKDFDYGVVPVENSTEGTISFTMDMFVDCDLQICSEIFLQIDNHLLVDDLEKDIREIYSHQQVFGQCRKWLHQNYPNVSLISMANTVLAAKKALETDHSAVLAGDWVFNNYPFKKKHSCVQDYSRNVTRFFVIGSQKNTPTGCDKTSILFCVENVSGALVETLKIFKDHALNLIKIESRPIKRHAWNYYFYIDFDGHFEDPSVKKCLERLRSQTVFLKMLGSYPKSFDLCSKK